RPSTTTRRTHPEAIRSPLRSRTTLRPRPPTQRRPRASQAPPTTTHRSRPPDRNRGRGRFVRRTCRVGTDTPTQFQKKIWGTGGTRGGFLLYSRARVKRSKFNSYLELSVEIPPGPPAASARRRDFGHLRYGYRGDLSAALDSPPAD